MTSSGVDAGRSALDGVVVQRGGLGANGVGELDLLAGGEKVGVVEALHGHRHAEEGFLDLKTITLPGFEPHNTMLPNIEEPLHSSQTLSWRSFAL